METFTFNDVVVRVDADADTVWLNLKQMAELYGRHHSVIAKHIKNAFQESELQRVRTCANFAQVRIEGGREVEREVEFYNLDIIIAVGFRVNSPVGTRFRQWANARLRDILLGRQPKFDFVAEWQWLKGAYDRARSGRAQVAVLALQRALLPDHALAAAPVPAGEEPVPARYEPASVPAEQWWAAVIALGPGLQPLKPWHRLEEWGGERLWLVQPGALLARVKQQHGPAWNWNAHRVRAGLIGSPVWRSPKGRPDKKCFADGHRPERYWVWAEAALPQELVAAVNSSLIEK